MSFERTTSPQLCFNEKVENVFEKISSYKDLGLIISSKLSWKPHIEKAVTKANKDLFMLNRNSPNVPAYNKLNLYKK